MIRLRTLLILLLTLAATAMPLAAVAQLERMDAESDKARLAALDSTKMAQMGLLPDSAQKALWLQVKEGRIASDTLLAQLLESYRDVPSGGIWVELQMTYMRHWGVRSLQKIVERHRGEMSPLMAELYLRLAQELYFSANQRNCNSCFGEALAACDTAIALWPGTVAASDCQRLRQRILMAEISLTDDNRPYILPFAADEWAMTYIRHRNATRLWFRLCPFDDSLTAVHQWDMPVTDHRDQAYHKAYVYIPPSPTGRYLLWASADSAFEAREALEVVFCDRYLMANGWGRGIVMDSRTGKPVRRFRVSLLEKEGKTVASCRTDRYGRFDLTGKGNTGDRLYAPYKGLDLARGKNCYRYELWDTIHDIKLLQEPDSYNPGDTVHFAITAFNADGAIRRHKTKVFLSNGDNDAFDSVTLKLDAHGYGEGCFVLPQDSDYYYFIETENGTVWLPMEDDEFNGDDNIDSLLADDSHCEIYEHGSTTFDSLKFRYDDNLHEKAVPRAVDASITLEKLHTPSIFRLNHSMMVRDGKHNISEAEFAGRFPGFAYDWRENNTDNWPVDTLVFSCRRHFDADTIHAFALPPLAQGVYRATLCAYRSNGTVDTSRVTLCSRHWPMGVTPLEVWYKGSSHRNVGDTLTVHFESKQRNVRGVYTIRTNSRVLACKEICLSDSGMVIQIPIKEGMDGILTVTAASVWRGEPSDITAFAAIGPVGDAFLRQTDFLYTMYDKLHIGRTEYRDEVHLSRKPKPEYTGEKTAVPSVWNWLGITPTPGIELYCPGEYWRWGLYSNILMLKERQ